MTAPLPERLRRAASELRVKPTPLSDFIPLLQQAADEIDAKQAHIDRLMLEYEPDEMTAEQKAEWARHQRAGRAC